MICKKCGAENIEDARFCANCGSRLWEEAVSEEKTTPEEAALEDEPVPEEEAALEDEPAPEEEGPVPEEEPFPEEEPALEEEAVFEEELIPEEEPAPEETPAKGRMGLYAVLAAVLTVLVMAYIVLSGKPPALTDEAVLAVLPASAVSLTRHEESRGRVQTFQYSYVEEHAFCTLARTEKRSFRYAGGAWEQDGEPEILTETEDWTALQGLWTEETAGPGGWRMQLEVGDLSPDGRLTGQIIYEDENASREAAAEECFGAARRPEGTDVYILDGTGAFQHTYLRIDRDRGVFFDNDQEPMEKSELPAEPSRLEPIRLERQEAAPAETPAERAWLVLTGPTDIYAAPDGSGGTLGAADLGTVLAYTGPENGWYQVECEGGPGYVPEQSALPLPAEGTLYVVTTTVEELNVRTGAGTDYDWMDMAGMGTRMVGALQDNGWYQVTVNGRTGYVSGDYVTAEPITPPES